MKRTFSLGTMLSEHEYFVTCFDNYVYGLAARQDAKELACLFSEMPFLLNQVIKRPNVNGMSYRVLSVAWAIFADQNQQTDSSRQCLRVLKQAEYLPDGHFFDRLFRDGSLELVKDLFNIFEIDPCAPANNGEHSAIWYATRNLDKSDGVATLKMLLPLCHDKKSIDCQEATEALLALQ